MSLCDISSSLAFQKFTYIQEREERELYGLQLSLCCVFCNILHMQVHNKRLNTNINIILLSFATPYTCKLLFLWPQTLATIFNLLNKRSLIKDNAFLQVDNQDNNALNLACCQVYES